MIPRRAPRSRSCRSTPGTYGYTASCSIRSPRAESTAEASVPPMSKKATVPVSGVIIAPDHRGVPRTPHDHGGVGAESPPPPCRCDPRGRRCRQGWWPDVQDAGDTITGTSPHHQRLSAGPNSNDCMPGSPADPVAEGGRAPAQIRRGRWRRTDRYPLLDVLNGQRFERSSPPPSAFPFRAPVRRGRKSFLEPSDHPVLDRVESPIGASLRSGALAKRGYFGKGS